MIKVGLIGKGYYGSFIHKKLTSEPISNICEVSWVEILRRTINHF